MAADPQLKSRIETALNWLIEDGAASSDALLALLVGVEDDAGVLIVDMIEQGLDEATQVAVIAWLRRRGAQGRPLFLLTRSSAISKQSQPAWRCPRCAHERREWLRGFQRRG